MAGLAFFAVNCWILGIMVEDVGKKRRTGMGQEVVEGRDSGVRKSNK